jgi:hypothetical protein
MQQNLFVPLPQLPTNCGRLDELRARANDGNDLHGFLVSLFCVTADRSGNLRL